MPICVLAPLQAQGVGVNITETGMLHRPQARWVTTRSITAMATSMPDQAGKRIAACTGIHGWFWRNRSDATVTVTLRVRGAYAEMVEVALQ